MNTRIQSLEEIQSFKGKYPKQIWSLFFSEMWERYCFYGKRGMLVFFMISQLDFHEKEANLQYGATQAFVYAFTFVGGLFADKILGFRKSLFWGGLLMIVGSLILAADPHKLSPAPASTAGSSHRYCSCPRPPGTRRALSP